MPDSISVHAPPIHELIREQAHVRFDEQLVGGKGSSVEGALQELLEDLLPHGKLKLLAGFWVVHVQVDVALRMTEDANYIQDTVNAPSFLEDTRLSDGPTLFALR